MSPTDTPEVTLGAGVVPETDTESRHSGGPVLRAGSIGLGWSRMEWQEENVRACGGLFGSLKSAGSGVGC